MEKIVNMLTEQLDTSKFKIYKELDDLVVVDYRDNLKRLRGYGKRPEKVSLVVYHHSAGNENCDWTKDPQWQEFVDGVNHWHTKGLGWPACGYHIMVPYSALEHNGKNCVILVNALGTMSYHTGRGRNAYGIGVCFQGNFAGPVNDSGLRPSDFQKECAHSIWLSWLQPDFNLADYQLTGHFNHGKQACPGEDLADIIYAHQMGFTLGGMLVQ
jgi:hypothetical protein